MVFFKKEKNRVYANVIDGLKSLYKEKLQPLEEYYKFQDFHTPLLTDSDFEAKPMILLVGQYSTGKTTFIKYLLEREFPGMHIGPEPTTDRFIAVMHGERDNVIPGNALAVDPKRQFRPLVKFGNAFLNRFQCSLCDSSVLENITIIDTPGILSGEKQRVDRGYDFTGVLKWFAERVDRIILLFDAHKLDISDEFRRSIEALKGYDDKIRIVLNKADMVDHQQLMRVYGALMWSLGKVLQTPEVTRVYIGSFWDKPLHYDTNKRLFLAEEQDLMRDLQQLPRSTVVRKLNDLIKRARLAKVHAYIVAELKKEMPSMFGKQKKQRVLRENLQNIYDKLQMELHMSASDFPDVEKMQEALDQCDFSKFHALKPKLIDTVDMMLANDISALMGRLPQEERLDENGYVEGGAFDNVMSKSSPFGYMRSEGINEGIDSEEWIVQKDREAYDNIFQQSNPVDGKLAGDACRNLFMQYKLPNSVLAKIWNMSDIDKDNKLDVDEFALAMHLIRIKMEDNELPSTLPIHLIPPSKRP